MVMPDSSLRLTCLATQIIKPQHCVRAGRKLQSREVPNVLTLFLFVRKWPSQVTPEPSQARAASGWLLLCARKKRSRPGQNSIDGMYGLYTCCNMALTNSAKKSCIRWRFSQRNAGQRCLPLQEKMLQLDTNHRNYSSVPSLTSAKNSHPT